MKSVQTIERVNRTTHSNWSLMVLYTQHLYAD